MNPSGAPSVGGHRFGCKHGFNRIPRFVREGETPVEPHLGRIPGFGGSLTLPFWGCQGVPLRPWFKIPIRVRP